MRFFTLAAALACFLAGCEFDSVYEKSVDLPKRHWYADSVYAFDFTIDQANVPYDVFLTLRNTNEYPFYNLYVNYELVDSTGTAISSDLRNFELFHPKTGEPYGGGLGSIYSHELRLVPGTQFPYAGAYRLQVAQNMRLDSLPGLVSVGAKVAPHAAAEE